MKNMDYNKYIIVTISILLASLNVFAQQCKIIELPRKSFNFADSSSLNRIYKDVEMDSLRFNILLLTSFGVANRFEVRRVSVENSGKACIEIFSEKSSMKAIKDLSKFDIANLYQENVFEGYYETACTNVFSHINQILVISNPVSKKWIELTSLGSNVKDILGDNRNFSYLNDMYIFLTTVSK